MFRLNSPKSSAEIQYSAWVLSPTTFTLYLSKNSLQILKKMVCFLFFFCRFRALHTNAVRRVLFYHFAVLLEQLLSISANVHDRIVLASRKFRGLRIFEPTVIVVISEIFPIISKISFISPDFLRLPDTKPPFARQRHILLGLKLKSASCPRLPKRFRCRDSLVPDAERWHRI